MAHILNSAVAEQRMLYIRNRPALSKYFNHFCSPFIGVPIISGSERETGGLYYIHILAISSHEKRLPVY